MKTILILFLIVGLALSFEIRSETFIQLNQGAYDFQTSGGRAPFKFSVSGLPSGIVLTGNRLVAQGQLVRGQYVLNVKAQDAAGKLDQKIVILNVQSSNNVQTRRSSGSSTQSITTTRTVTNPTSNIQLNLVTQPASNPSILNNQQSINSGQTRQTTFTTQTVTSNTQNSGNSGSSSNGQALIVNLPPQIPQSNFVTTVVQNQPVSTQSNTNVVSQNSFGTNSQPLDINSLNSFFGSANFISGTTTSTSAQGTTTSSNTNPSGNNLNFGTPLELNINSINNYFQQIRTQTPTNNVNNGRPIGSTVTDILNGFSTPEVTKTDLVPQIRVDGTDIISTAPIRAFKFDPKDTELIDDAEATKLFEAQKTAANNVATAFNAVQQISGFKNTVYDLLMKLSGDYETLQESLKTTLSELTVAANNKTKIQSAITNLNNYLTTLNGQIQETNSRRLALGSQRIALLNQNNQSDLQIAQLRQNTELLNQQLLLTNNSLSNNAATCSRIDGNLLETNKNISITDSQLGLINQQLITNTRDTQAKQGIVDDLLRRLAIAQRQLADAQATGVNLNKQKLQAEQRINALNQNLVVLKTSQTQCGPQLVRLRQTLVLINNNIQSNTTAIRNLGSGKQERANQITSLQNQIDQENVRREQLLQEKNSAGNALTVLESALPIASNSLNQIVSRKSQLEFSLQSQQKNLNQTIAKFRQYERKLQIATMNLQNARALSQQADQAVNALLARKKNILPFAVGVDSINGALIGQTVINDKISIDNWFNFLSANFGGNLPDYIENERVETLYPWRLSNSLQNNVESPVATEEDKCYSGRIVSISNGFSFVFRSDITKNDILVEIPDSAELTSNVAEYRLTVGDTAIVKAVTKFNKVVARKVLGLRPLL